MSQALHVSKGQMATECINRNTLEQFLRLPFETSILTPKNDRSTLTILSTPLTSLLSLKGH